MLRRILHNAQHARAEAATATATATARQDKAGWLDGWMANNQPSKAIANIHPSLSIYRLVPSCTQSAGYMELCMAKLLLLTGLAS